MVLYDAARCPYCARVRIVLAEKGLSYETVEIDLGQRPPWLYVKNPLGKVPVLEEDGGLVLPESEVIAEYLEERFPEPPLFPREPARRAELDVFLDWFDRVWKRPPNELERELSAEQRAERRVEQLATELRESRDLFESLLAGREYLLGDEFSVIDCAFFPFLKYGLLVDPNDTEPFHQILVDHLSFGATYPRLAAWVRRVDERPRA